MSAATALSCVSAPRTRGPTDAQQRPLEDRIAEKDAAALAVIEDLARHRFDEVQARLHPSDRAATSPQELASFWLGLEAQCGSLLRTELTSAPDRTDAFDFGLEAAWISPSSIACYFERGVIKATISVEADGSIGLLRIHAAPPSMNRPACVPPSPDEPR